VDALYELQKQIGTQTGHLLGCPFGNLAVELATHDEVIRRKVDGIFTAVQRYFRETLEHAVDSGEIAPVDVAATAQAMLAYVEGVLLLAKTSNDAEVIRRLGPAVREIRIASASG
jgi:TetR/AcrR family transcriptional repressor of nem operon